MKQKLRMQSDESGAPQGEDTLADQVLVVIGSLTYCAEDRLDQILRKLPGMRTVQPLAFGGVRGFSDCRETSGAALAEIGGDFAIYMTQVVLIIQLADKSADASPAVIAHQRRAAAARASEDGRTHILLRIGGSGTQVAAAPSAELAPLCNLQWSDIANVVGRLTNPTGVERRLLAQLSAMPDTAAKPVVASRLTPLRSVRIAHARLPRLGTSCTAVAPARAGAEKDRQSYLRPLSRAGITTTTLGRIR